ncbi:hypothetical protein MMC30_004160 [Trapelia coarctata]|nr:hypothetical protein [Trapelia coarctata]
MRLPHVQAKVYETMFRDGCLPFSPPDPYKLRVLKRLVQQMEDAIADPEEDEISDDLTVCLSNLMSQSQMPAGVAAQQKQYVTYTLPESGLDRRTVTTLEARAVLASSGTTGLRTWEAALHLGTFLSSANGLSIIKGRTVLELGAGTGFVSMLCATHLGAKYVLSTDGSGEVVEDIKANLCLNALERSTLIDTTILKWGHALIDGFFDDSYGGQRFDVVLGADVTYDQRSIMPLLATLKDLFVKYSGIEAIIAATVRNEQTLVSFEEACDARQFTLELMSFPETSEQEQKGFFYAKRVPIRLYKIMSKFGIRSRRVSSTQSAIVFHIMERFELAETTYGGPITMDATTRARDAFLPEYDRQSPFAIAKLTRYARRSDVGLYRMLKGLADPQDVARAYLSTDPPVFIDVGVDETTYVGTWLFKTTHTYLRGVDAVRVQALKNLDPRWIMLGRVPPGGQWLVCGALTDEEAHALNHGVFPRTLAQFGDPAPYFKPGKGSDDEEHRPKSITAKSYGADVDDSDRSARFTRGKSRRGRRAPESDGESDAGPSRRKSTYGASKKSKSESRGLWPASDSEDEEDNDRRGEWKPFGGSKKSKGNSSAYAPASDDEDERDDGRRGGQNPFGGSKKSKGKGKLSAYAPDSEEDAESETDIGRGKSRANPKSHKKGGNPFGQGSEDDDDNRDHGKKSGRW